MAYRMIYSCADLTHQLEFHESAALTRVTRAGSGHWSQSGRPDIHLLRDKHPLAGL